MLAKLERLAAANIQLLPITQIPNYFVFERDGFVALVERRGDSFGAIGSAGILSGKGFAPLIRRGEQHFFVAKGFEQEATPAQIESLRSFQTALESALA